MDKIAKLKQAPVQPPPLESFPKVGYCQDCGEPAPSASKTSKAIDFSSIDPEKEWECFGTIVKDHPECKECPFAVKCEEKKNSKAKK